MDRNSHVNGVRLVESGCHSLLIQVSVLERSPLVKAAVGLPAAVAQPPEGSNPFPLRQVLTHVRASAAAISLMDEVQGLEGTQQGQVGAIRIGQR